MRIYIKTYNAIICYIIIFQYICTRILLLSNIKELMIQSNPIRQGRVYEIAFNTVLGLKIKNYIQRSNLCNSAIRDFLHSVEQKYAFPVHITDDTSYCISDDCEAGGIIAIIISKSVFHAADIKPRFHVLWDTMQAEDEDSLYVFPRIESLRRYVKYGTAVRLFEKQDPRWDFLLPSPQERSNGLKLHMVYYKDVRHHISKEDLSSIVSKPGKSPSPFMRLAVGREFVLNQETLDLTPDMQSEVTQSFGDAVALYKEWVGLPVVASNTLARILGLKAVGKDAGDFKNQCFCEWRTDTVNRRHLVYTGLTSSNPEMIEINDLEAWNKSNE